MFFLDLQGQASDPATAQAIAGLEQICEQVRVLGSYRASSPPANAPLDGDATERQTGGNRHDEPTPSLHSGATDG
jgi:hypothetical protein